MVKRKTKGLRLDFYVVSILILFATVFTAVFEPRFIISTALFFIIPSLYLFLRRPRPIKRILVAAFFFGFILLFEMDFIAELNKAWVVNNQLIPYKFFGVASADLIVWGIFWVFFIIVFYEHFFENERKDIISPHFIHGLIPASTVFVLMIYLNLINPNILKFPYAYLILGALSLTPFAFASIRKTLETPKLLVRFLKVSFFFLFCLSCP